jgi:hypothetical protein
MFYIIVAIQVMGATFTLIFYTPENKWSSRSKADECKKLLRETEHDARFARVETYQATIPQLD